MRRGFALLAVLGTLAWAGCLAAPSLPVLMVWLALVGVSWGRVFLAGLRLAGEVGHHGRESLFVGARIGLTLAGLSFSVQVTVLLAAALWGMGGLVCLAWLGRPPNRSSLA